AAQPLDGLYRHARDQWLRAAQSIPLNIAMGNGRRSLKDLARFLDIASGSALECAAIQDVLVTTKGSKVQDDASMKAMLHRIVKMLTRMAMKFDGVASRTERMMLRSITIRSIAALSTSTNLRPKKHQNYGIQWSGGSELFREIFGTSRRSLNPVVLPCWIAHETAPN
ncbi:MAG: four helix bundle protein, partial [Pirellulaceae bacterium]